MTPYTYISSVDYIDSLVFDYVETYSSQRGAAYEENRIRLQPEYDELREKKEANQLTAGEKIKFSELYELFGVTQYLINGKGQFHPSAQKTHTFKSNDPIVERIKNILTTEIHEIPGWLCEPVYRDALVFYDTDNNIVSVLNICLSCQYMETSKFNYVNGDYKTYDLFKRFFIDIGHDVEDPTYFVSDDIDKMKLKYKK